MDNNIYIIGMMGAGKSTIGRLLSDETGKEFIDSDDYLIDKSKYKTINDIFEKKGEDYFRSLESKAIEEISKLNGYIVATGGGIILNPFNIKVMKETGIVIYLNSTIDNLVKNLYNSKSRPLLNNSELESKIRELLDYRQEKYKKASDYLVDVSFKTKEDIIKEILNISWR